MKSTKGKKLLSPAKKKSNRKPIRKASSKSHPPKGCLIVECDSDTLGKQGVRFSEELKAVVKNWTSTEVELIRICGYQDLHHQFADVQKKTSRFDIVILVGHGGPEGMRFAEKTSLRYEIIGRWIEPFKPKTIFLVTCYGGRIIPSQELFDSIKSLKEIYGTPVSAKESALEVVKIIVPLLLLFGKLDKKILLGIQGLNLFMRDGLLLYHAKKDFLKKLPYKILFESVAHPILEIAKRIAKSFA